MSASFKKKLYIFLSIIGLILYFRFVFTGHLNNCKAILHYYFYDYEDNDILVNNYTKDLSKLSKDLFLKAKEELDKGNFEASALVAIQDGKFYVYFSKNVDYQINRIKMILNHFAKVKVGNLLKDNIFLVRYHDTIGDSNDLDFTTLSSPELKDLPIFVFAINQELIKKYPGKFILFPDDYTIGDGSRTYHVGWKKLSKDIEAANTKYPWNSKIDKIFWRGKLTDCTWPNCSNSPRLNLVKIGQDNKWIDALFAGDSKEDKESFEKKNLPVGNFISQADQIEYKYQIAMDGVTSTYPGYLYRLYSNSVVLKQETGNIQWFYPLFKPFEHYIPLSKDLSDISEKYEWLQTHDAEAKKISENAQSVVKKSLLYNSIFYSYTPKLLNSYAEKLDFDVHALNKIIIEDKKTFPIRK